MKEGGDRVLGLAGDPRAESQVQVIMVNVAEREAALYEWVASLYESNRRIWALFDAQKNGLFAGADNTGNSSQSDRTGKTESNNGTDGQSSNDVDIQSSGQNYTVEDNITPGIVAIINGERWAIPMADLGGVSSYEVDENGFYHINDPSYSAFDRGFAIPDDAAMDGIVNTIYKNMHMNIKYEHGGAASMTSYVYGGTGERNSASEPVNRALKKLGNAASYTVHDHWHSLASGRGAFYPSPGDFKTSGALQELGMPGGILVGKGPGYEKFLFYNADKKVISIPNDYWINRGK